ncbi:MAG: NUDIX hydrolase [Spirosomataceae bacterium]
MNLFIHDVLFCIQTADEVTASTSTHAAISSLSDVQAWRGEIILRGVSPHVFGRLLIQFFKKEQPIHFTKLTYIIPGKEEKKQVKKELKRYFSVIDAAGGVVFKETDILVIHRLGKWDLPKGKRDKGEKMKQAAVREVQEECGVLAALQSKITTTWHTYTYKGKPTLKKTKWYAMQALDDKKMTPQLDENIEKVEWVAAADILSLFQDTYSSIQFVWQETQKLDL